MCFVPHCAHYLSKDTSSHDGDWNHYKQRANEQKEVINDQRDIITQLSSLLETMGYHLPAVRTMSERIRQHTPAATRKIFGGKSSEKMFIFR